MNTIDARLDRARTKLDQMRMKLCGEIRCGKPATLHVICDDGTQARLCDIHYTEIGGAKMFAKVQEV